jgi:opacity protein-like surface antigen
MKHIFTAVVLAVFATVAAANDVAQPKTKQVCKEVKDSKTGKSKKQCKTIKVHKKYEGTAVPDKKSKK